MPRTVFSLAAVMSMAVGFSSLAWALPSESRQADLLHLLKHDCGSCHGMTMKGGLGPPLLPAALRPRGDEELITTILEGVPHTPMPPWKSELTDDDARWILRVLREGASQ